MSCWTTWKVMTIRRTPTKSGYVPIRLTLLIIYDRASFVFGTSISYKIGSRNHIIFTLIMSCTPCGEDNTSQYHELSILQVRASDSKCRLVSSKVKAVLQTLLETRKEQLFVRKDFLIGRRHHQVSALLVK